jgi:hypothetical protein
LQIPQRLRAGGLFRLGPNNRTRASGSQANSIRAISPSEPRIAGLNPPKQLASIECAAGSHDHRPAATVYLDRAIVEGVLVFQSWPRDLCEIVVQSAHGRA